LDDTKTSEGVTLEDGKTLRDLITKDNPKLSDSDIVEKLTENAKTVYRNITSNPAYKGAKFYPEWKIYSEDSVKTSDLTYRGLKGIADLIVVKSNGTIDIIDFKVCTRPFEQWCTAKQYHTEYQLGLYRAILA
jgi:hypothetical protein